MSDRLPLAGVRVLDLTQVQLGPCATQVLGDFGAEIIKVENVVLAGIGGTGIVTVDAILAQAAHLDGIRASVLDLTGMAQKYGAVMSHLRFMPAGAKMPSSRLAAGEADTVIGCDLIVTAGQEALSKMAPGRTFAVVNSAVIPTGEFTRMPDWDPDAANLVARIEARAGGLLHSVDAERLATALMGDSIATNMFLLGFAWQHGRVPGSLQALQKAIEESGVDVDFNRASFDWGRRMAVDPEAVERSAGLDEGATVVEFAPRKLHRLEDIVADRVRRLTDYQDSAYAERFSSLLDKVRVKDDALGAGGTLARAVARSYYKLLANKDEYEVARLYALPEFRRQIDAQFDGDYTLHLHLGAWPIGQIDPASGKPRKREVGPWMLKTMGVLQHAALGWIRCATRQNAGWRRSCWRSSRTTLRTFSRTRSQRRMRPRSRLCLTGSAGMGMCGRGMRKPSHQNARR